MPIQPVIPQGSGARSGASTSGNRGRGRVSGARAGRPLGGTGHASGPVNPGPLTGGRMQATAAITGGGARGHNGPRPPVPPNGAQRGLQPPQPQPQPPQPRPLPQTPPPPPLPARDYQPGQVAGAGVGRGVRRGPAQHPPPPLPAKPAQPAPAPKPAEPPKPVPPPKPVEPPKPPRPAKPGGIGADAAAASLPQPGIGGAGGKGRGRPPAVFPKPKTEAAGRPAGPAGDSAPVASGAKPVPAARKKKPAPAQGPESSDSEAAAKPVPTARKKKPAQAPGPSGKPPVPSPRQKPGVPIARAADDQRRPADGGSGQLQPGGVGQHAPGPAAQAVSADDEASDTQSVGGFETSFGNNVHLLSQPEFLSLMDKFEAVQRKAGDSAIVRARKALQRDSKAYRDNKNAIASRLGLTLPASAADVTIALSAAKVAAAAAADSKASDDAPPPARPDSETTAGQTTGGAARGARHKRPAGPPPAPPARPDSGQTTGGAAGGLAAGGAGGGRRPPGGDGRRPPAPAAGGPLRPAPQRPDMSGLSLGDDDDAFDAGSDLFDLLRQPSQAIHSPGDFIASTSLLGGQRYSNIASPRSTVVSVDAGDGTMQPIHANHVNDRTIAAQGLMTAGADPAGIPAFFAAVLDQDVANIVNLTNQVDGQGPRNTLAVEYWPGVGITQTHILGTRIIDVTNNGTRQGNGYLIVNLTVEDSSSGVKHDIQVHQFTGWPDHGVPMGGRLDQFRSFIDAFSQQAGDNSRTLVHCKAGVGRTGTFIVLGQLLSGIRAGTITRDNLLERIGDFVWEGRVARGPAFVQTRAQMTMLVEQGLAELDRLAQGPGGPAAPPGGGAQTDDDDDDLSALGAVGGVGISDVASPGGGGAPMTLSDVQDMLKIGQIVSLRDRNRLMIDDGMWAAILDGLSIAELEELAMRPDSLLTQERGYGPRVLEPVRNAYAQKAERLFSADAAGGGAPAAAQTVGDLFPGGVTGTALEALIADGRIVDSSGNLIITPALWSEVLGHLSVSELRHLAMFGTSPLRENKGYGDSVLDPIYTCYAEKRLKQVYEEKGNDIAEVTLFIATNKNYKAGTRLGRAAWSVLTKMTMAERAAKTQGAAAQDGQQ